MQDVFMQGPFLHEMGPFVYFVLFVLHDTRCDMHWKYKLKSYFLNILYTAILMFTFDISILELITLCNLKLLF